MANKKAMIFDNRMGRQNNILFHIFFSFFREKTNRAKLSTKSTATSHVMKKKLINNYKQEEKHTAKNLLLLPVQKLQKIILRHYLHSTLISSKSLIIHA